MRYTQSSPSSNLFAYSLNDADSIDNKIPGYKTVQQLKARNDV